MYYFQIVLTIVAVVCILVCLANSVRLLIRLLKQQSDKKNVIKGTFISTLIGWLLMFSVVFVWQDKSSWQTGTTFSFLKLSMLISFFVAFASTLPYIYWKTKK